MSLTTVAQTIVGNDAQPASGQAVISLILAGGFGGDYVGEQPRTIGFVNGAFTVDLVPNDQITPTGTYYRVSWCVGNPGHQTATWTENWTVPTSASPVTVESVVVTGPPAPGFAIQAAQLAPGGTAGQVLTRDGSAQGQSWQTPAGGGGAVKQATLHLSNAQLLAMGVPTPAYTMVPAQGPNTVIIPVGLSLHYIGTVPLSWSALGLLEGGAEMMDVSGSPLSPDGIAIFPGAPTTDTLADCANSDLVLAGTITGGDGTLDLVVTYSVAQF